MRAAPVRIALVGAGAIAELGHLPAALSCPLARVTALVDRDRARAEELARRFGVPRVLESHSDLGHQADAAVIALPHALHAPVAVDLLSRGIHLLVEKPMATSVAECDAMIAASEASGAVLAVGLMRRFQRPLCVAKDALERGLLGRIEEVEIRDGFAFSWPSASGFYFRKAEARGGILLNLGSHDLDLLAWWMGDPASIDYFDDSFGGLEAECEARLVMPAGSRCVLQASAMRKLRNTAVLRGSRGRLEVPLYEGGGEIQVEPEALRSELLGEAAGPPAPAAGGSAFEAQMADWIDAILERRPPRVTGTEGRRSLALIEACYALRRELDLPWMRPILPERQ